MKIIQIIILTVLLSCSSELESKRIVKKADAREVLSNEMTSIENVNGDSLKTEITETFVDSLNIGEKGKCKIELIKHGVDDNNVITIKFYTRKQNIWHSQNTYSYETNALMEFQPNISDFNHDNYNDITFISGSAARGANEVRRLFIYDNKRQELISIVNSQDFPNMRYNKELNCIDAFIVTGGTSTHFAKIKNDSLIEFASVHNDNYRTVYEIDKYGMEKILRKDTIIDDENIYVRYRNYRPLKEYKE